MNKGQKKRLIIVLVPLLIIAISILYISIYNSIKADVYICSNNMYGLSCSSSYAMDYSILAGTRNCRYYGRRYLSDSDYIVYISYRDMSDLLQLHKEKLVYGDFCFQNFSQTKATKYISFKSKLQISTKKHIEVMERISSKVAKLEYDLYINSAFITTKYLSIPIIFLFSIWIFFKIVKWIAGKEDNR